MSQKKLYRFRTNKQRNGTLQVMFRHIPGKWISTGTDDLAAAVLFAEKFIESEVSPPKNETLKQFASGFFTEADPKGYRNRQEKRGKVYSSYFYKSQQALLDNYVIPRFGNYLLDAISDVMIEDWVLNLKKKSDAKQDLSNDTKNKIIMCFRTILQEAKRGGIVSSNTAKEVTLLPDCKEHRLPVTKGELAILFPLNDKDLISIWGNLFWSCYFLIMRDTGFRPGEVAALGISSWIPQLHGVYTRDSIMQVTRQLQHSIKTTAKGQPFKIGILTDQTERILKLRIEEIKGDSFLFKINGRFLRPEVSNKHFKSVMGKMQLDLNGRSQYSLRHSFETDIAGNVENKMLMELMAHTSYRAEYDHRTPEDLLKQLQPVKAILENRHE
jgi:integrase